MAKMIVAVTGGIGSGKTAVSERFEARGINVVDMDVAARAVVEPGQPALEAIVAHFGSNLVDSGGQLDRRALRARVFDHPEERAWLERLLHPLINQWTREQLEAAESPYAIVVNPLLRHKGGYVDRVLVVDVPTELQIRRTMERDGVSEEQAATIVKTQIDRESRLTLADDVIENGGDIRDLDSAVDALHTRYLALANG